MTEAFAYAYNNNPQLLAQRALLRATDEQVPQALANWRPTVTFTGQAGFTRSGFEQPGVNTTSILGGVTGPCRIGGAVAPAGTTCTTPTQFASFDPPVTRNPWHPGRTPGGSSSGSAAAVACGMCLGALGSQTGGSITRPVSYCGVAGCKPTYGRVSCRGVVPLASSMDHPGPLASCVRDLALLLQAIGGPDPLDPACSSQPMPDLLAALDGPARPPRLGRLRGLFEDLAQPPLRELMDQVSERFAAADAVVKEVALPAGFAEVLARHRTVMAVEAAAFHGPRLRRHPQDYEPKIRQLLQEVEGG